MVSPDFRRRFQVKGTALGVNRLAGYLGFVSPLEPLSSTEGLIACPVQILSQLIFALIPHFVKPLD